MTPPYMLPKCPRFLINGDCAARKANGDAGSMLWAIIAALATCGAPGSGENPKPDIAKPWWEGDEGGTDSESEGVARVRSHLNDNRATFTLKVFAGEMHRDAGIQRQHNTMKTTECLMGSEKKSSDVGKRQHRAHSPVQRKKAVRMGRADRHSADFGRFCEDFGRDFGVNAC